MAHDKLSFDETQYWLSAFFRLSVPVFLSHRNDGLSCIYLEVLTLPDFFLLLVEERLQWVLATTRNVLSCLSQQFFVAAGLKEVSF